MNPIRVLALLLSASIAAAQQTQPAQQMPPQAPQQFGEQYQPSGWPETYNAPGVFYPSQELRALPMLRANAAATRAQLHRAENELTVVVNDIKRQFKHSTDLKEALADEQDAYDELLLARRDALEHVRNDPAYQAAVALRDRLSKQIELHRDQTSRLEELLAMATVKLSYGARASAMEAAALSAQPKVQRARKRLVESAARITELRQQFDESVRSSPEATLARQTLADARIAAIAADAAYVEAAKVANVAFNYAYYLRQNPYPIASAYYSYGSGYGYGSVGYPIGYPYAGYTTISGRGFSGRSARGR